MLGFVLMKYALVLVFDGRWVSIGRLLLQTEEFCRRRLALDLEAYYKSGMILNPLQCLLLEI